MPNTSSAALTAAAMLLFIGFGVWMISILFNAPQPAQIKAQVVLKNDCGITDSAFLLLIPSTGKKIPFIDRKLTAIVTTGEPLLLAISPAFSHFVYDGSPEPAAPHVTMTVQCDSADYEGLLNRPLRDQFRD